MRYLDYLIAMILAVTSICAGQNAKTAVKHTTAPATSPSSGKEMFMSYCASCHGKDAKGDGPA
ncbi:MAG TPA: c-type cytochrome, partial [Verrucomicrobiae bacterium]|nr:c-type cytochrome [Verrucomicrobiae bacterium]